MILTIHRSRIYALLSRRRLYRVHENTRKAIATVPLLLPIIDALGVSRIHFGIFHTVNLLIGYCTPPVGAGLMIIASITRMNMSKLIQSFLPFFIPLLVSLFLLVYIPQLSTWLPNLIFGN